MAAALRHVLPLAALACASLGWIAWDAAERERAGLGARLYRGELALAGRIVGHEADLPAGASRCINCHGAADGDTAAGATLAPRIGGGQLGAERSRRGGPPARYDATSLCRALRQGVDPAAIVLPRTMPRYELADVDCRALWAYLQG